MGKKKGGRGGGTRSFVTSAEDLENRNQRQEAFANARKARRADGDDEGGSDEEKSEGEGEDAGAFTMEKMKESVVEAEPEPEKAKKKKGLDSVIDVQNPNAVAAGGKMMKAKDMGGEVKVELTRREREEIAKQRATEDYQKRHAEGKTDEYKKDMEKLAVVRKRREELDAAKAEAAKEQAEAEERAKARETSFGGADSDDDTAKLDPRDVKKMNAKQLKDLLKERGLSLQGQKKDLIARLLGEEL